MVTRIIWDKRPAFVPKVVAQVLMCWSICILCSGVAAASGRLAENVILISLDAARADRFGCYGYARPTTPNLDKLAGTSIVFTQAIAASSWTIPSHLSMLSGLYPSHHGVIDEETRLKKRVKLLSELLRDAGYHTFARTGGGYVEAERGFSRGFDEFRSVLLPLPEAVSWAVERARDASSKGERFFMFLHTYDTHSPYDPRDEYLGKFRSPTSQFAAPNVRPADATPFLTKGQMRYLSDRYDEQLQGADTDLAPLLDFLASGDVAACVALPGARDGRSLFSVLDVVNAHGHGAGAARAVEHTPYGAGMEKGQRIGHTFILDTGVSNGRRRM